MLEATYAPQTLDLPRLPSVSGHVGRAVELLRKVADATITRGRNPASFQHRTAEQLRQEMVVPKAYLAM
ncbi:MAG: hypothetical protein QF554_00725 [Dehalococcoidia bacterium]|jgi:hypothetical protein|nr:hypothetical protein [Dehalococcoidia bacterium]